MNVPNIEPGVVAVPGSIYVRGPGYYGVTQVARGDVAGLDAPPITWFGCREQFHGVQRSPGDTPEFFYTHKAGLREKIAFIVDEVENRLRLVDRTAFTATPTPTITHVRPSPFWTSQHMRYALFSIVLRAALDVPDGDSVDVDAVLNAYKYVQSTKLAVDHFLAGNTFYVSDGPHCGWVRTMSASYSGMTKEKLKAILVPAPQPARDSQMAAAA